MVVVKGSTMEKVGDPYRAKRSELVLVGKGEL